MKKTNGSVLMITLLVLLAITILGIMSIRISMTEKTISSSERDVREVFHLTEGATNEGVQRLADSDSADLEETFLIWHHSLRDKEGLDFRVPGNWRMNLTDGTDNCLQSEFSPNAAFAAVECKVANGGSLIVTQSRLYLNRVYGLCQKHDAEHIIEVGYYSRYGSWE